MAQNRNQLSPLSRRLVWLGAIGLLLVLYFPMWRIELDAPQYPEGLALQIFPGKLAGDVEIINGLNHYIGMKTLHAADFVEFTVLPYLIVFFALFAFAVALMNRYKWLSVLFVSFALFCVLAMADFWRWEYNYGHELNPEAAIQVPGMAYQPPLIGFRQLLNFGAYSIPDTGGWIFIGVGLMFFAAIILQWKMKKKSVLQAGKVTLLLCVAFLAESCSSGPEAIRVGKDHCHFCEMTISSPEFAAEIVTLKGKVFKFDDLSCAVQFLHSEKANPADIAQVLVSDYNHPGSWLDVNSCFFVHGESLHSPMNGNFAAFSNQNERDVLLSQKGAEAVQWIQINK